MRFQIIFALLVLHSFAAADEEFQITTYPSAWSTPAGCGPATPPCPPDIVWFTVLERAPTFVPGTSIFASVSSDGHVLGSETVVMQPTTPTYFGTSAGSAVAQFYFMSPTSVYQPPPDGNGVTLSSWLDVGDGCSSCFLTAFIETGSISQPAPGVQLNHSLDANDWYVDSNWYNVDESGSLTITPVSEPSTGWLLSVPFIVTVATRRFNKSPASPKP